MSIRTLLWAKEQTVITSTVRRKNGKLTASEPAPNATDKLALIAIGDEASERSWDALIGVEDIAVFAGCTRRAARESLGRLERAGFIRCRYTQVESGQSGWRRIYLLAAESPLFQGLIEVDFGTTEHISRYQMRTFRDRHSSTYIPSDSLRNRPKIPAQEQGEHGSSPKGRGNTVPPARGNTVPPEGEHGSSCEGEHGSSPYSASTEFFSPSDARAAATAHPTASSDDGRTEDAPSITEEHCATATELAQQADLSKVGARQSQVRQVADALAAALALGYSAEQLRAHLRAKLNEARTVRYVLNALDPARLDDIQPRTPAPSLLPVCGECEARDGDGIVERVVFVEDADGATRAGKCPRCHPYARTAQHNGR